MEHGEQTRRLGQNLLVSETIAEKIVGVAQIEKSDIVFEIGTGRGIITRFVAERADKVFTCDIDPELIREAKFRLKEFANITYLEGDAFSPPICYTKFDVCVTGLPYSESRNFIEWLALASSEGFKSCTAVVQLEFGQKLVAIPGDKNYRSVSVISQILFDMQLLMDISRDKFKPIPKVDSVLIRFQPKKKVNSFSMADIDLIKSIFSFRGRLLRSAINKVPKLKKPASLFPESLIQKRVENLSPDDFIRIINVVGAPK